MSSSTAAERKTRPAYNSYWWLLCFHYSTEPVKSVVLMLFHLKYRMYPEISCRVVVGNSMRQSCNNYIQPLDLLQYQAHTNEYFFYFIQNNIQRMKLPILKPYQKGNVDCFTDKCVLKFFFLISSLLAAIAFQFQHEHCLQADRLMVFLQVKVLPFV